MNRYKAWISTGLANLIYYKVEKNQVPRIETIEQELCKLEEGEQQIGLDEEKDKSLYKTLLIWDIQEEEFKPSHMQVENGQDLVM